MLFGLPSVETYLRSVVNKYRAVPKPSLIAVTLKNPFLSFAPPVNPKNPFLSDPTIVSRPFGLHQLLGFRPSAPTKTLSPAEKARNELFPVIKKWANQQLLSLDFSGSYAKATAIK
ncbi:MAG: hypothetical protein ACRECJ_11210, partial [Limisphaerales bacterium]